MGDVVYSSEKAAWLIDMAGKSGACINGVAGAFVVGRSSVAMAISAMAILVAMRNTFVDGTLGFVGPAGRLCVVAIGSSGCNWIEWLQLDRVVAIGSGGSTGSGGCDGTEGWAHGSLPSRFTITPRAIDAIPATTRSWP